MNKLHELQSLVQGIEADAEKFFNRGNSAAGTRVRKAMLQVKRLAQEVRVEVAEARKQ